MAWLHTPGAPQTSSCPEWGAGQDPKLPRGMSAICCRECFVLLRVRVSAHGPPDMRGHGGEIVPK